MTIKIATLNLCLGLQFKKDLIKEFILSESIDMAGPDSTDDFVAFQRGGGADGADRGGVPGYPGTAQVIRMNARTRARRERLPCFHRRDESRQSLRLLAANEKQNVGF